MIAFVKGRIAHKDPGTAVIECGGVGYLVKISLNTYEKLQGKDQALLHTHFMVREDSQELFGFAELSEKALFEQLITINGVGGNTAMTILSSTTVKDLERAIETEDVGMLKRVKGVGPKTAGRIILELKGKLKLDGTATAGNASSVRSEALAALTSLGMPKAAMEKRLDALLKDNPEIRVEDLVKLALKG